MTFPRLNDSAVVRRLGSDRTHVARIDQARRATRFGATYWAPALYSLKAACGVTIPTTAVVMATGSKVRCSACKHITGITEQSPTIHERMGPA